MPSVFLFHAALVGLNDIPLLIDSIKHVVRQVPQRSIAAVKHAVHRPRVAGRQDVQHFHRRVVRHAKRRAVPGDIKQSVPRADRIHRKSITRRRRAAQG